MLFKNVKFAAVIAVAGLFSVAACGDDGDEPAPTPTTTTPTTTTGGVDCNEVCGYVYDCGADGLCAGFSGDAMERTLFINGQDMDGCVATCEGPTGSLLQGLVDMNSCDSTVTNLQNADMSFADVCENGFSGGGGGGQGGGAQGGGSAQGGGNAGGGGGA